jgi:hypothetical protein
MTDVWLVAECFREQYGVERAIAELNDRRPDKRATAAMAYLKREYSEVGD